LKYQYPPFTPFVAAPPIAATSSNELIFPKGYAGEDLVIPVEEEVELGGLELQRVKPEYRGY
jgi:hypothetical protein